MSFILDALKKSEIERQRQTEPGLMDAGSVARRGALPVWAVLLGLLLTINIAVLLVMLMRNGAHTARSTPAPGAGNPPTAVAAPGVANSNPPAAGVATPGVATPGVS